MAFVLLTIWTCSAALLVLAGSVWAVVEGQWLVAAFFGLMAAALGTLGLVPAIEAQARRVRWAVRTSEEPEVAFATTSNPERRADRRVAA